MSETVNFRLRSHVTRVGFDLTLGQSHIAALVDIAESTRLRKNLRGPARSHPLRRAASLFAGGAEGLIRRGLLVHHYDDKANKRGEEGLGPHYTITPAGHAVVLLLKESGLYAEYARAYTARSA